MYFAHSANRDGKWHRLRQHLDRVASLAELYFPCHPESARYLGLLHDLGKCHPDFQTYLRRAESGDRIRGPDHKLTGALEVEQVGPVAMVLQGHHGGLRSRSDYRAWSSDGPRKTRALEAQEIAREQWPDLFSGPVPEVPRWVDNPLTAELYLRMLFSALVDADYTDTAAHFTPTEPYDHIDLSVLAERFETYYSRFGQPNSLLNQLRADIHDHCVRVAAGPTGLYRLAVPTGGGKTLSGMAFALEHALKHELKRIIVAVPYLSITEQTADVYRSIFGEHVVLEHHSASENTLTDEWSRLAAENWDAPVIVTTTVQLFESLFSNRPQQARKVHRLASSVIILDEVQSLPTTLLDPILDGLRNLTAHYRTSVVLSTATQPAFDVLPTFGEQDIKDIIPDAAQYYSALDRVGYEIRGEESWQDIAREMCTHYQALAIVNTKADAFALLDELEMLGVEALHLSTQLCGAHRRAVLADIRSRLDKHQACILVSTQVVEAGVDIDFPVVFRAMASFDSIIQAAGRCNREAKLKIGRVIVFETAEGHSPPGFYRAATNQARTVLGDGGNPNNPESARTYFQRLYAISDSDAKEIQKYRSAFDYPEVAKRFRIIDDDTVSVIVDGYSDGDEIHRIIDALCEQRTDARMAMRALQPYIVNVRSHLAERYLQDGWLSRVLDGTYLWAGDYDQTRGIVPRSADVGRFVI